MIWIAKRWRFPKVIIVFFLTELLFTVPALVLFALADPNEYRTRLWEDGYLNGFNSNPKAALYQAANYEPVVVPLVWSQFITSFNVVISVLSMFFLLVKGIMFIMHIWLPIISFLVHGGIAALWAYSTYAQTSSDMTDPKRPQPGAPWYITKSCSVAHFQTNINNCKEAKACLAITVIMLAIFSANTVFAAWCMYPTAEERADRQRQRDEEEDDEDDSEFDPDIGVTVRDGKYSDDNSIEMDQMQVAQAQAVARAQAQATGVGVGNRHTTVSMTPMRSPQPAAMSSMTPRTTAFHRLGGGDLPLRRDR